MSGKHSTPIRGLMGSKGSPLFQGKFGKMFRSLPGATFGTTEKENADNLAALGQAMSAQFDAPKDGRDSEESGIPALYTYLAQFIDHDITFDPASSLQKHNDPDALVDFRTPAFDLDNVYGRGPDDQPYMYEANGSFLLGDSITGGSSEAKDLPRNAATPRRALIGDPRNDENIIVSQLQGLFLRFHNRTAADHSHLPFTEVQRLVRFHYQFMVLNDFLPRIVHSSVLDALKVNGRYEKSQLKFFHWRHEPFMPVEFSVAAYRLGHSMIRPGYRLNDEVLLPIFPVPSKGLPTGLTGFGAMPPTFGIDWGRFVDLDHRHIGVELDDNGKVIPGGGAPTHEQLEKNKHRLQFAYRIDTSLANPLSHLPHSVVNAPPVSLAQRNLERGWRLGIPSGQRVAHAMGVTPLADEQIIIGKASDAPDAGAHSILDPALKLSSVFKENCPLWTYILAEAMHFREPVKLPVHEDTTINTPRLGPVGGRIVAEVFLGLMFGDNSSFVNLEPMWTPKKKTFALKDFVAYALGK